MAIDHSKMKLGKLPPRFDARTPRLDRLMAGNTLPPVPDVDDRWKQVKAWIMGENDRLGDCTCAAAANAILNMSTAAGSPLVLTDEQIVAFYSAVTGYDPNAAPVNGENPTDTGAVETDVLTRWSTTGILDGSGADKLIGYAVVDPGNIVACKQSMYLFGNLYIGLALPIAAQTMDVWDAPKPGTPLTGDWEPGSWGGHAIITAGYAKDGTFTGVTWAEPKTITRAFWRAYVDEAYVLLDKDWIKASGDSANGLSLSQLTIDMFSIRSECQAKVDARKKAAEGK